MLVSLCVTAFAVSVHTSLPIAAARKNVFCGAIAPIHPGPLSRADVDGNRAGMYCLPNSHVPSIS